MCPQPLLFSFGAIVHVPLLASSALLFLLFTSNKETIHEKNHDNGSKTKPYNFSVYALDLFINLTNSQNVIGVPYSSFISMWDRNYIAVYSQIIIYIW